MKRKYFKYPKWYKPTIEISLLILFCLSFWVIFYLIYNPDKFSEFYLKLKTKQQIKQINNWGPFSDALVVDHSKK